MKSSLEDLAIFGGNSVFSEKLHVGHPNIGSREKLLERINDILRRRWLTNDGPYVQELERRIAHLVGAKHCIVTCNGTIALQITIRACKLDGEVLVPSFTFVATAHALEWQNIKPVFCDIDPFTHHIDPDRMDEMVTPMTTGIIGVHLWGQACDVEAITEIAQRRNLTLLFDAAHAFGCSYKGQMIGSFGTAEIFSFHATKFINSFEGGAVITNDDLLASEIRLMRNFGFAGYDDVGHIGINAKMNEVAAAMGLTSLESIDEFLAANLHNYRQYLEGLSDVRGIRILRYDEAEKSNYQYIVLEIDENFTHIGRDQVQEILWAENVIARRYFYPGCHRMEPYRSRYSHITQMLPNTERATSQVLCLPTGTTVGATEIGQICDIIRFVIRNGREITKRMSNGTNKRPQSR